MDLLTDDSDWQAGLLTSPVVEVKLLPSAADEGLIEGYGASFNGTDHGGDTIAPGAFAESLAHHHSAGSSPAMLWAHAHAQPIGRWLAMGEDAHGLRVRGVLNLETPAGRRAHSHLKAGDLNGLSVGYQIAPGGSARNDRGRTLTRLHLHEVSVVAVPMDPRARVTNVKGLEIKSLGDLEALLRDAGLARGAARKLAAGGWPALNGDADPPPPDPAIEALTKALDRGLTEIRSLKDMFS